MSMADFYSLTATDAKKGEFSFASLKGKARLRPIDQRVVLIVNVASKCGYTKQYSGLEQLYKDHHAQGLEIVGFPCNQFGGQEPGTEAEILQFCSLNYGVTFPVLAKVEVNGAGEHPVYKFLKGHTTPATPSISWNFEKFLVDRSGKVVARFPSSVTPEQLVKEIEPLLK
ncbi:Glutathione peroxidase 2 [Blastocladiella emersonii ATCC 22665]|nr:Glutathione peroxidase 2 [Blastocladiella emersonii ATCC 22665]